MCGLQSSYQTKIFYYKWAMHVLHALHTSRNAPVLNVGVATYNICMIFISLLSHSVIICPRYEIFDNVPIASPFTVIFIAVLYVANFYIYSRSNNNN